MDVMSAPVECVERGAMILNREYQDLLGSMGFLDFDSIWNFEDGRRIKDIPCRSVTRIPAECRGRQTDVYLKRHKGKGPGLGQWISGGRHVQRISPGKKEFENICSFREHGLPTVVPIAAGERKIPGEGEQSFVLTEDFSPYVQLEALVEQDPGVFMGESGLLRKEELLREIAALARKMHRAGFNHKDFNATHILLHYGSGCKTPALALFDLQRVESGVLWRWRWPIKSMARLNYSLPRELFSQEDRVRMWKAYRKKDQLHLWGRVQWIWIQRKTQRIARHTTKLVNRRRETANSRGEDC
jgi:heptose I phosphotransferase